MRIRIASFIIWALIPVMSRSARANELRVVALSDVPLPGIRSGSVVDFFHTPVINDSGRVAIQAMFVGTGDTAPRGIWTERIGRLRPVMQNGDTLPSGGTFGPEDIYVDFNNAGNVVISQHGGIVSDRSGSLQSIANTAQIAPGSTRQFSGFSTAWLDDNGRISFEGFIGETGGFWTDRDGALRRLIAETDVLPGLIPYGYRGASMSVTPSGEFVINVAAERSQPPTTSATITLVGAPGGFQAVLREGDVVPVAEGTATIARRHTVSNNNQLHYSFPAELVDTDGDTTNDLGVWKFDGDHHFLARSGATLSSGDDAVLLRGFNSTYISEAGSVAIQASVSDIDGSARRAAILKATNRGLNRLATVGESAVGVGSANYRLMTLLPFNGVDQAAFLGFLEGPGINSSNDYGLWIQDSVGELQLVIRTGDLLEVAPGDRRTISSFLVGQPRGGAASSFNSRGQIAFSAEFTNGTSGVFVTDRVSIVRTLVSAGDEWRYLDDGSNQGTGWRDQNFNDSNWRVGRGELGYGDADERTIVRCGPSSTCNSNNHVTTYFRKDITIDDPTTFDEMTLELLRDDGAAVYINGQEVYRDASLAPNAAWNSLANFNAAPAVGGDDEDTFRIIKLASEWFRPGRNVIAVEVHQSATNSSDLSFDLRLTGTLKPQVVPEPSAITLAGLGLGLIGLRWRRKRPRPFSGKTCVIWQRTLS